MLLGNRKKQGEEQNWCIVLAPLQNEIDKKKVARKISEVFSISNEEAFDLVSNTPIILLDNLARSLALKLKEYFGGEGAEIILTNDIFFKRKCYRTVWPEPPNLSFLDQFRQIHSPAFRESEEMLEAQEAIKEIRTLQESAPDNPESKEEPGRMPYSQRNKEGLLAELEAWRKECMVRRAEVERLQEALARLRQAAPQARDVSGVEFSFAQEKEKQIKELRTLLGSAEEKYEALKLEYQQARQLFEEKMTASSTANDGTVQRTRGLENQIQSLIEENERLTRQLKESEARNAVTEQRFEALAEKKRRLSEALQTMESDRGRSLDLQAKLKETAYALEQQTQDRERLEEKLKKALMEVQALQHAREALDTDLKRKREEMASLEARTKEKTDLLQLKLEDSSSSAEAWRKKAEQLSAEAARLQELHQAERKTSEHFRIAQSETRSQYDSLLSKYNALVIQYDHDKLIFLKKEDYAKKLESELHQWKSEAEKHSMTLKDIEQKLADREGLLSKLQSDMGEQTRILASAREALAEKAALLEAGSRELESVRKELEGLRKDALEWKEKALRLEKESGERFARKELELKHAREQMEALKRDVERRSVSARREQVEARLSEKESELKRLVSEQSRIEAEIRQREETMRLILSRQDIVEKEIVESKQIQKQIMEQIRNYLGEPDDRNDRIDSQQD